MSWAQSISRFVYGPTSEERVKKWQHQLKTEQRMIEREQRQLQQAQDRTRTQLKQLANKGQVKDARILAREVVRSKKQSDRLATSKAMLNSISMQLNHQLATLKISGTLQKSTEILKLSNSLIKLPELNRTMVAMSAEMSKAGIMSEMMDDTLDTALDEDEDQLEDEASEEIEKVLFEITDGKLGTAVSALPKLQTPRTREEEQEEEAETQRVQAELDALLGS